MNHSSVIKKITRRRCRKVPTIIISQEDLAGKTIKKQLLKLFNFQKRGTFDENPIYQFKEIDLVTIKERTIFANHLDEHFKTDLYIFGSKHKSESGKPSLLTHCTGNWSTDTTFGGEPKDVAVAPAFAMKEALKEITRLKEEKGLIFDTTLEVTHHGPTNLTTPLVFVELGSNESNWQDTQGAEVVARAIMKVADAALEKKRYPTGIGFGGMHYCPNFNKLVLNTEYALSHIIPKYHLDAVDEKTIKKAIERTVEPVEFAVLDNKGMNGAQKAKITEILNRLDVPIKRVKQLLKESS